jgi:hypothetical protein
MVFHAVQGRKRAKDKGLLNVFRVYDHTNDQMYTHSYKKQNWKAVSGFYQTRRQKI